MNSCEFPVGDIMFKNHTERARKVMELAGDEARQFNHEYIGTEHLLLGLLGEGTGVGAGVLKNLGVDLPKVRLEFEKLVKRGPITAKVEKAEIKWEEFKGGFSGFSIRY